MVFNPPPIFLILVFYELQRFEMTKNSMQLNCCFNFCSVAPYYYYMFTKEVYRTSISRWIIDKQKSCSRKLAFPNN